MRRLLLFLFFFQYMLPAVVAQNNVPQVKGGVIDLRNYDFSSGPLVLNGEWEFYWRKMLSPQQFASDSLLKPDTLVTVPNSWRQFTIDGKKLPALGYATYRCRAWLPTFTDTLCIKVPHQTTAFRLYINNRLIYQCGNPDTVEAGFEPNYLFKIATLYNVKKELDIVMQISNFAHDKPGFTESGLTLGYDDDIREEHAKRSQFDFLLLGSIIIMALYHMGLYLLRRSDRSPLFFSIFCFMIALRILVTGEYYLLYFLPNINWDWLARLEYLTFYASPVAFCWFVRTLFPKEYNRNILKILIIVCSIASLSVIVLPPIWFTWTLLAFQIFVLTAALHVTASIVWAVIRGREGALVFFIGFLVFFMSMINDILYVNQVISTGIFVQFGVFIFIFSQAYLLSARFSKSFARTEQLTEELNIANRDLEKRVEERTAEISRKNEVLEQQTKEILEKNAVLEQNKEEILAQSENLEEANQQITEQKEILERAHHHITESIMYASRIQNALIQHDDEKYTLPPFFVLWKPRDIVSGDFYWVKSVNDFVVVVVADCTGHGVPGAFMSMLGTASLNEIILRKEVTKPDVILDMLRTQIKLALGQTGKRGEQQDGMDMGLCVLDVKNRRMEYAGAHLSLCLAGKKRVNTQVPLDKTLELPEAQLFQYAADKQPIGVFKSELPFTVHTIEWLPGDWIYMSTDGFTDQFGGPSGNKFTTTRFRKLLLEKHHLELSEQWIELEATLADWRGTKHRQIDDVLVLGMQLP